MRTIEQAACMCGKIFLGKITRFLKETSSFAFYAAVTVIG